MVAQRQRTFCLFVLCWTFWFSAKTPSQIATDGTAGVKTELQGPHYFLPETLGTRAGRNLFHSFEKFTLGKSESASFSGAAEIRNVIGRITGGTPSTINGRVHSAIDGANLYLLNPAGIFFGPDAQLDVSGSVAIGTASYVKFGDGTRFGAIDSAGSTFTAAPLEAFEFMPGHTGEVRIENARLQLPDRAGFTIAANRIDIRQSHIHAPGGTIHLHAVEGAGETPLQPSEFSRSADRRFSPATVPSHARSSGAPGSGNIHIRDYSRIDVGGADPVPGRAAPIASPAASGAGGGRIVIRGGQFVLDGSALYDTAGNTDGGGIHIETSGALIAENAAQIVTTTLTGKKGGEIRISSPGVRLADGALIKTTTARGPGRSGNVSIEAGSIEILSGSELGADSFGPGDTGNLDIRASRVQIDSNGSASETPVGTSSFSFADGGRAGDVIVRTGELGLHNQPGGGLVGLGSRTFGKEPSGNIDIEAQSLAIDGGGSLGAVAGQAAAENTAIGSVNFTHEAGQSGNVTIRADDISIRNFGIISAATFGRGDAGNINIRAGTILLDDSSIVSSAAPGSAGNGGNLNIEAGTIDVRNRGGIAARTSGAGNAGNVHVQSRDLLLDFGAVSADVMASSTGHGGEIRVEAQKLQIRNGGGIIGSTAGPGNAAQIFVSSDDLLIDGRSQLEPFSTVSTPPTFFDTGIASQTLRQDGGGNGGQIVIRSEQVRIEGKNGAISAESNSEAAGGSIDVRTDTLQLSSGGKISSASVRTGNSGRITITARESIAIIDGSAITAAANDGSAQAITLNAGADVQIGHSRISAQAGVDGGEIHISASGIILLESSGVTSESGRHGGNIFAAKPRHFILNQSSLDASAIRGNGGNIQVDSAFFLTSAESRLSVTSRLGLAGVVRVLGPSIDLTGQVAALPVVLLSSEPRLPEHCGVKIGTGFSSFRILGREVVPWSPNDWITR